MRSLTELYTPAGLLRDGDGDGLPDGFGCRFLVGLTPGAVDLAARLGLESAAFSPGFTEATAGEDLTPVIFGPENPACPEQRVEPGCGLVALTEAGLVITGADRQAGWMAARWLAETFPHASPGGPLLAELADGRPVRAVHLRAGALLSLEVDEEGRPPMAADKPTLSGIPEPPPFLAEAPGDLPPPGVARLFTVDGLLGSSDSARHDRTAWQVVIPPSAGPEEIAALCELAARIGVESTGMRFPVAVEAAEPGTRRVRLAGAPPERALWREGALAWTGEELVVCGSPAERVAALRAAAAGGLVDGLHGSLFTRRAALPEAVVDPGEPVFEVTLRPEWEVERLRRLWRVGVLPRLTPGLPAAVEVRLSEPLAVRQALERELRQELAGAGVPAAEVLVRSAYKQGFHWLEEEMLPRLASLRGLARVTVTCPRFGAGAPAGSSSPAAGGPVLGSGATPPPGPPTRLRGPEGAARDGRPLEMPIRWLQELYPADELLAARLGVPVTFELEEAEGETCRLTAFDGGGSPVLEERFTPVYTAEDYLADFPLRGRIHPATGWVRVVQGGSVLLEERLETDFGALWHAYQAEVLPRLREYITQRFGPAPDPSAQPFFGVLLIEARLSEENRRLGIREEQISPLDALHEELYFHTLDYLNELGLALTGAGYPAPGAVEPWIRGGEGGPEMRVRLYPRWAAGEPLLADRLPERAAELPPPAASIPLDQVIGPEQLPAYLAYLARLPGVRVWRTGLSFAGRATWALSVTAPTAGAIAPPQKLSAWRPTLQVNARRHANEVSSTNSILKLAEIAATTALSRRLNLVLSPMENPDGAAVHYAMQREQPTWKLHAARFNAAGVDFGIDCFHPNPRFGESRTQPTLWRAFLPDIWLDDHGYPSHEWVQPYSGHNSAPYFPTSWWMPNALIYAIFRWMDSERFPASGALQEAVREALAAQLTSSEEIERYTRVLLDRYIAYGRRHLPEKFPLELHKGFVSLTRKVQAGPEALSFSGRFPHITAAEVITEAPDETAQGDYLALCARAHLEGDLAVASVLIAYPQPVVRRRFTGEDGATWWAVGRERPFRVEA
ncbi:MAG: M14 family zinc carboxypeptidase [Bacillota bacterium]